LFLPLDIEVDPVEEAARRINMDMILTINTLMAAFSAAKKIVHNVKETEEEERETARR
jgi:hypothetical protein